MPTLPWKSAELVVSDFRLLLIRERGKLHEALLKAGCETYAEASFPNMVKSIGGLSIFLAVYLLLPIVFVCPLSYMAKAGGVKLDSLDFLFAPLEFLDKRVPVYSRYLMVQGEWASSHRLIAKP